jgi:hypothetical protein
MLMLSTQLVIYIIALSMLLKLYKQVDIVAIILKIIRDPFLWHLKADVKRLLA